jgi:hypothetical protein
MNRCDDRARPLFATDLLTRAVIPRAKARSCRFVEEEPGSCLQAIEKNCCG